MSNLLLGMGMQGIVLAAETDAPLNRIFGLDLQLLADASVQAVAIFVLFMGLSYLLFNPVRDLLQKRQQKIQDEMDFSAKEKADAMELKADYDTKLKEVNKEAEVILSEARKKALKKENEIVDEAKMEASRIIDRANKEVELEKKKVKDEVKQEMIAVASLMAGKIVASSIDSKTQDRLVEETLKEMGDNTWQS